uniref:non-specific serine/threonine protein kinase n=1 Tax=Oreochromis niloticus TaxID=8128 RepID=A0A669DVT4_ORENI
MSMESIGKFEFSRKDLIGHGAFAVVFKGRHKEVTFISDVNFELCGSLEMNRLCSKGTLSEDTIRVFLQQISRAMKVLHSKGIVHRDLKPQNILLCHPEGRRSSSINTTFKLADFGFARHLQTNTMAATLCGSPMYMAPEVIMSRNYNAKADLWSIGTIVYQSLTGKAPFYASTPHELRLFYESNRNLFPNIPKETSDNLKHLLLGLLRRNHKDRISFEEFFNHPFLETSSSTKKCSSVPVLSYPSSGSGSSSSSSSTSQLASPQHSDGEMHQPQAKLPYTPVQDKPGFLQKETANQDGRYIQSFTEDYVLVPAQFPSKTSEHQEISDSSGCFYNFSPSVPIPVPTQIQNYQRMQCVGSHGSTRHVHPSYLCTNPTSESDSYASVSTGRLSDMLLKAALGAQLFEEGRDESLSSEKSMEITAPPAGCHGVFRCSDSPVPVIFTMGSPSSGNSPPDTMSMRRFSGRCPVFYALFSQEAHTDALTDLRFTLAFVQCVMELASSKDPGLEPISSPDVSFLDQSLVADQISLLSREWSYAEQLVLYMKAEEFLSSALHSAKENIKKGELFPSATVKQVIRKLNELYKNCVAYCRSLSDQLQTFLLNKQKLMDNFNALTAEKLIYNHTVHMVKSAALDEMFHHGTTSVQRYHKALVLMEGLSRTLTEQEDIDGIEKCKQCIERRLSTLHTKQYL